MHLYTQFKNLTAHISISPFYSISAIIFYIFWNNKTGVFAYNIINFLLGKFLNF